MKRALAALIVCLGVFAGADAASALHESGLPVPENMSGNDLDIVGQPKFVAPGVTDVRVRYRCVGGDVRIGVRIRSEDQTNRGGPDQTNRGARFGFVFGQGSTAIWGYVGADLIAHFGNPEITPLQFLAGEGLHGRRLVGTSVRA